MQQRSHSPRLCMQGSQGALHRPGTSGGQCKGLRGHHRFATVCTHRDDSWRKSQLRELHQPQSPCCGQGGCRTVLTRRRGAGHCSLLRVSLKQPLCCTGGKSSGLDSLNKPGCLEALIRPCVSSCGAILQVLQRCFAETVDFVCSQLTGRPEDLQPSPSSGYFHLLWDIIKKISQDKSNYNTQFRNE